MTPRTVDATAPQPAQEQWVGAWRAALDAFEVDIEKAEAMLRSMAANEAVTTELSPWRAPALPGVIPGDMVTRARRLHERQVEVAQQLSVALVQARSASRALRKFSGPEAPPVYIDTAV